MFVTMKGTRKAPHREEMALADSGRSGGSQYRANTRYSRINFLKFNGEDLRGWIYRCEIFFEYDDTAEESKVKVLAIHLEGRALQWHQMYMKTRFSPDIPEWEEYVRALRHRFGTSTYLDPLSELVSLRQQVLCKASLISLMNC